MSTLGEYVCSRCSARFPVALERWRCDCGAPLDLGPGCWDPTEPAGGRDPLWEQTGPTPLVRMSSARETWVKCDHLLPTGSFKDRGARVLVELAAHLGARRIVLDSSGNAGASTAAYAARRGIPCEVVTPAATSVGKVRQMQAYGAHVTLVRGSRDDARRAAEERASEPGTFYAAHAFNPFFVAGVAGIVRELLAQLPVRDEPVTVVAPTGSGSLLLGLARGLARSPGPSGWRLVAVQPEACAPLLAPVTAGATSVAEGLLVSRPPRLEQMSVAIRRSGGEVVAVQDDQVIAAQQRLAEEGFDVEPTAAAGLAGLTQLGERHRGTAVVVLTGAGWKSRSGDGAYHGRDTVQPISIGG